MHIEYAQQDRGTDEAYERYLAGMDQSMRQKVAMTAAHLLAEGTVADMGMGSGAGSAALAALYPRMQVVGVDVNLEMVERARKKYQLPNLRFEPGDVASRVFADCSLDAVFNSSVLHHVTSFNGYAYTAASRALANQATQLAEGGSLIVRDFVAPEPGEVLLDVPIEDGTAELLERFAREFRRLAPSPGFALYAVDGAARPGWQRYRLEGRHAAEFLLRKDYRADWDSEILEEYCYFTQHEFEAEYLGLGLRLLASMPIRNPWIMSRRFEGHAEMRTLSGEQLEFPPTNFLIVGEKVPANQGVRFEAGAARPPTGFLISHVFEHRADRALRDLVRRPGTSIDVVPWFEQQGSLFVIVRRSHPRPVLQAPDADGALDGASPIGYVTEPILAILSDKPVGLTVEQVLAEAADIRGQDIRSMVEVATYYPSPGGLLEEVRAVHVQVEPRYSGRAASNGTGFSTTGVIRAVDARQLLRAAQVGALPDARLELNVYELLLRRGEEFGPWIGAALAIEDGIEGPAASFSTTSLPRRRAYVETDPQQSAGFLRLESREFLERNAAGEVLCAQPRDYVLPANLSSNTIAVALLRRQGGTVLIGLDDDDLPAAQCFTGSSAIWVAPAWRIPRDYRSLAAAEKWVKAQIRSTYGFEVTKCHELGGRFYPSAGVTPEAVFPLAVSGQVVGAFERPLTWFPLYELLRQIHCIQDGHLRIVALRSAHALGVRP